MKKYYDILGISESASKRQIKSAFRKLAMKTHPDKNPNTRQEFIDIFEAYQMLINHSENISKPKETSKERKKEYSPTDSTGITHYRSEAERYANMKYGDFIKSSIMRGLRFIDFIIFTLGSTFFALLTFWVLFGFLVGGPFVLINGLLNTNEIKDHLPLFIVSIPWTILSIFILKYKIKEIFQRYKTDKYSASLILILTDIMAIPKNIYTFYRYESDIDSSFKLGIYYFGLLILLFLIYLSWLFFK